MNPSIGLNFLLLHDLVPHADLLLGYDADAQLQVVSGPGTWQDLHQLPILLLNQVRLIPTQ